MILLQSLITEERVRKISLDDAMEKKMFGPIYHGTNSENRAKIDADGFKIFHGDARSGGVSNGYEISNYYGGIPAPVHHLGFGVYFTTVKAIAKRFNGGSIAGMKVYYVDAPKLETINFAAPSTMMKWWLKNGYDYNYSNLENVFGNEKTNLTAIKTERVRATMHLTDTLKSHFDAVWFKGKTLYSTLDGDQVCVYDTSKIYEIDMSLAKPMGIGSRVVTTVGIELYSSRSIPLGTKGIIVNKQVPTPMQKWAEGSDFIYTVKFEKGGTQFNILQSWIKPYQKL